MAVVVVYALLGFFLAPWLIKKNAIDTVREMYGAELRIEQIAVNPFVLRVSFEIGNHGFCLILVDMDSFERQKVLHVQ